VIEQAPRLRPLGTCQREERANALAADVDALAADLDRAVGDKQVRRLRPELLVRIEAVDALQLFDGVLILEQTDLPLQRRGAGTQGLEGRGFLRAGRARPNDHHRCTKHGASRNSEQPQPNH
jgi:hypothetical protein